jgi:hypothetical protein
MVNDISYYLNKVNNYKQFKYFEINSFKNITMKIKQNLNI